MAAGMFSKVDPRTGIIRPMTAEERKKSEKEARKLKLQEKAVKRWAKRLGGDSNGRDFEWWMRRWLEIKSQGRCRLCGNKRTYDQLGLIDVDLTVSVVVNRNVELIRACSRSCQEKAWRRFNKKYKKLLMYIKQSHREAINKRKKEKKRQRVELHRLQQQLDLLSIKGFIEQCLPPSNNESLKM